MDSSDPLFLSLAELHRRFSSQPPQAKPRDICERWHLDPKDEKVAALRQSLKRGTKGWTRERHEQLLSVAEAIAHELELRDAWNPKDRALKQRYRIVARQAKLAAELALSISGQQPVGWPMWLRDALIDCAWSAWWAASALQKDIARHQAVHLLRDLRAPLKTAENKRASNVLLAELVGFATGKGKKYNETFIRRYGQEIPSMVSHPGHAPVGEELAVTGSGPRVESRGCCPSHVR